MVLKVLFPCTAAEIQNRLFQLLNQVNYLRDWLFAITHQTNPHTHIESMPMYCTMYYRFLNSEKKQFSDSYHND